MATLKNIVSFMVALDAKQKRINELERGKLEINES